MIHGEPPSRIHPGRARSLKGIYQSEQNGRWYRWEASYDKEGRKMGVSNIGEGPIDEAKESLVSKEVYQYKVDKSAQAEENINHRVDTSGLAANPEPPEDEERKQEKRREQEIQEFERTLSKYKNILDRETLEAAYQESRGITVVRKYTTGEPFDHVTEARNAQQGLKNIINDIERRLGYPKLGEIERSELTKLLSEASKLLEHSKGYIK